jgi:hypothetical protein
VRSFLVLILIGTLGFLVGCGGNGTPAGVVLSVTLTPSSATLTGGQSVNIVASVANDSSGKGVSWSLTGLGTLSAQTTTSATYTAPNPITATSIATVVATSTASSSVTGSLPITLSPPGASNTVPISVNGGLLGGNPVYANGAFVSVQICGTVGSASCQTIDNILVDTGSFGLRVLGSQLTSQVAASLSSYTSNGDTLYDCVSFLDGSFLWGAVAPATIVLGDETAPTTSIQVIANPNFAIPGSCSSNGTGQNEDTQALLGANGILGVGPEPFDCGTACDPVQNPGGQEPVYYLCGSGGGCSETLVSCGALCQDPNPNIQVTNPVFNFPVDNNGVILTLSAVNDVAPTASGTITFGIGTETNNALPTTATVLNLDQSDNFITNFASQSLTASFIDSGSNGLFFQDAALAGDVCPGTDDNWYCPPSTVGPLSATNVGASGTPSSTVTFSVDNFETVTGNNPTAAAFSNLAGPLPGVTGTCSTSNPTACTFDWGLPFFYSRSVFTAIDNGTSIGSFPTPFFAY